jgi:hypothetical protein
LQPLPVVPPKRKRPMTSAERQRVFRERQVRRQAELEQANSALYTELADTRRQLATARAALADANAEIERLSALACKHPAAAVDGGRCQACGSDVW